MSVLYSILKPIIKKAVKGNIHQETYEEFVQVSRELQAKFKFRLPRKKGYEFRDEIIDGCHCIVGHKSGSHTKRVILYLMGGANRRYQMPKVSAMVRYMEETDRDLWIPLYPLYPDHNLLDEVEMICHTHSRMLQDYEAKEIAWLGFSSGADIALAAGRHIIQKSYDLPMPGLFHAYPFFTFVKEGKQGECEIIGHLKA